MTQSPNSQWLPLGYRVGPGIAIRNILSGFSIAYQIYETSHKYRVCIAVQRGVLTRTQEERIFTSACEFHQELTFSGKDYITAIFGKGNAPERIGDIPNRKKFLNEQELLCIASKLASMKKASWEDSLYFSGVGKCVELGAPESRRERSVLGMRLLTGGVEKLTLSVEEIQRANPTLSRTAIERFIGLLGPFDECDSDTPSFQGETDFCLPGYPIVERIFRDKIIQYYRNKEKYMKLNVRPVNGMLLYGPPGSGKTYAVRKLVEYLQWPLFEIGIGELGSKYIHETSTNIRKEFQRARSEAPSIIMLDELDAIGVSRSVVDHHHKLEEVSELLKQMDSIGQGHVVAIATTNLIEKIDPALMRKGRFDLLIEVPFPDKEGIVDVLKTCIALRPHVASVNPEEISVLLHNCSAADIENVVNEAGRIAVEKDLHKIDNECLRQAAFQSQQ